MKEKMKILIMRTYWAPSGTPGLQQQFTGLVWSGYNPILAARVYVNFARNDKPDCPYTFVYIDDDNDRKLFSNAKSVVTMGC